MKIIIYFHLTLMSCLIIPSSIRKKVRTLFTRKDKSQIFLTGRENRQDFLKEQMGFDDSSLMKITACFGPQSRKNVTKNFKRRLAKHFRKISATYLKKKRENFQRKMKDADLNLYSEFFLPSMNLVYDNWHIKSTDKINQEIKSVIF